MIARVRVLPLALALLMPASFAQDSAPAGKFWVCEGGPSDRSATRYVALFLGSDTDFPAAVNYGHEFCDYLTKAKASGKQRLLCDCNLAATEALARRWLEHDLEDPALHYEKVEWRPKPEKPAPKAAP